MGEPAYTLPDEVGAEDGIRPDLPGIRALEGGGEGDGVPAGNLKAIKDTANDSSGEAASLYNPEEKSGRFGKASSRLKKLSKNKLFVGIGATGGLGLVAFLIFVFLFFSALKIPNFMAHITAYQFARVTRQISQNAANITEEKIALDAADNSLKGKIKARFNDSPKVIKTKETFAKFDKYRPNKIIKNFNRDSTFKLVYDGNELKGVTLSDRTVLVDKPTGFSRFVPGAKFRGQVSFAQDIAPTLKAALKADDVGPIVRSRVSAQIRQELGIGLIAWKVGEYRGKTPDEAKLQTAKDMVKAIENDAIQESKTSEINEATKKFRAQLTVDENDPKALTAIVENGGIDKAATEALDKGAANTIAKTVASALSPFYAIAVPVCLVYDGSSIDNNGPTINNQTSAQIKTYNHFASASSQIVNGYGADSRAAGAYSARLGNTDGSPSEQRARGLSADTSAYLPTQASPAGNYTVFDAAFGGGPAIEFAKNVAEKGCGVATNTSLAVLLGIFNSFGCVFGGETVCITEKAVQQGAETATGKIAGRVVAKIASKQAADRSTAIGGYLANGVKDLAKSITKITAATLITKMIVLQRANSAHNGLQSRLELAADVDSGGNQLASTTCQRGLYCRPLTDSEAADSHATDKAFLDEQASHKSVVSRVVSIHNPDSLVSHVAMLAISKVKPTVFNDLLNFSSTVLSPTKFIGTLFNTNTKLAIAEGNSTTKDYGNVQWGYSKEESGLLANDPSYKPLENQYELDQAKTSDGKSLEDNINDHYKSCFDGSKPIGTLLGDKAIMRDESGDVIKDDGLCSPNNLGPHNTDKNAGCGDKGCGDLVFRWRVAQSYNSTFDQLTDQQDVTADDPTSSSTAPVGAAGGSEGVSADGFVFPVKTTKTSILAGSTLNGTTLKWCPTSLANCHQNYNAADIFQPTGTTVVAVRDGTVVFENNGTKGGTGSFVILKSDSDKTGKSYIYYYAHLLAGSIKVLANERIKAGQELGQIGTSADAQGTAAHLHIDAELAPPATTREPCISAGCATGAFNFINIQPALVPAYNNLPN